MIIYFFMFLIFIVVLIMVASKINFSFRIKKIKSVFSKILELEKKRNYLCKLYFSGYISIIDNE